LLRGVVDDEDAVEGSIKAFRDGCSVVESKQREQAGPADGRREGRSERRKSRKKGLSRGRSERDWRV
jgi:hypothetical protein